MTPPLPVLLLRPLLQHHLPFSRSVDVRGHAMLARQSRLLPGWAMDTISNITHVGQNKIDNRINVTLTYATIVSVYFAGQTCTKFKVAYNFRVKEGYFLNIWRSKMRHETCTLSTGQNTFRPGDMEAGSSAHRAIMPVPGGDEADKTARCMLLLRQLAAARSSEEEARCREQLRALPGWNAGS